MSRGTNRWNLFLDDADRQRFVQLLAATCHRYSITVHAYCLMGNHFHLVVYCKHPNLSGAMRDIKSRYAKHFNRAHSGSGSVFEAPFVEVPILDDEHLRTEIRYTHRNPLDLNPNTCLGAFQWSSHGIYLGHRPTPLFVDTRIARELFGANYQSAIECPRPTDKVQNKPTASVHSPGECTLATTHDLSLAGILRHIAHCADSELNDVRPQRRNGLIGVAILVAFEIGGYSAAEIAEPFGYKSTSAVHMARRRAQHRIDVDDKLRSIHHTAMSHFRTAA